MLTFSADPKIAESQMHAVIFLMTTFGYIDGDFDHREKAFVRDRIRALVKARVDAAEVGDAVTRLELVDKFTSHFHEVFEQIDARVRDLMNEPVATGEDAHAFLHARLKQQCLELMQGFDKAGQEALLAAIDELLMADGEAHPAELQFRGELASFLEADLGVELVEEGEPKSKVRIEAPAQVPSTGAVHPFFEPFERHYQPEVIDKQIAADLALLERVRKLLDAERARGAGKLTGKRSFAELAGEAPFLDGHVYVVPPRQDRTYELLVIGDLHGCYSVLKAAIMQSGFFEKVNAYRKDPTQHPEPHLILLGDYIDRGLFSLNGVLRGVLQLLVTAPEFVHVLRGNHEYYVEHEGMVYGGVQPAEAINTLKPYVPIDAFRHYIALFEALPSSLSFGELFFVHGGIPKDRLVKERWKDLSSLNDPDIRFQMMWSDPSKADVIPADLQDKSSRFAFGRLQFRAFMQRLGATTMVRGHEKVIEGFHRNYDGDEGTLITLFSSGGADNDDLPQDSSYRAVTPMVLTVRHDASGTTFTPWAPDYRAYNDPARNGFYRAAPPIPLKA